MVQLPGRLERFVRRTKYLRILRNRQPEADAQTCRSFLRPGDMAIDIGANIGIYTKVFSECVGPEGSVHSIEPIPETFDYLLYNVSHLGLKNVFVYPVAVDNRSGVSRMSVPLWHGGRKNIYESRLDENGEIPVRVVRLDDLFAGMKPAFIKIDVEGHELEVIKGAREMLTKHRPALLVEVSTPETEHFLAELGYSKCKQGEGSNQFFSYS